MNGSDHAHLFGDTHFCTNHQATTKKAGGKFLVSSNGKSRRWICAACLEIRNERMAKSAASSADKTMAPS